MYGSQFNMSSILLCLAVLAGGCGQDDTVPREAETKTPHTKMTSPTTKKREGAQIVEGDYYHPRDLVSCLAVSSDGKTLASGGRESRAAALNLFDMESRKPLNAISAGHYIWSVAFLERQSIARQRK